MITLDQEHKNKFRAMKAVYTYMFPSVRPLVDSVAKIDHELFLTQTSSGKAMDILEGLGLHIPFVETDDGRVDLDNIHEPVIDKIVNIYGNEKAVTGLKDYKGRFFTGGSSQGLFHLLADLKARGFENIYTLKGEYEGYKEYGRTLGLKTIEVDESVNPKKLLKGYWFISNPSARDGNIIKNEFINDLCDAGHKVILDLAYVGSTKEYNFDASHENIDATLLSFSKPYGVFRFRLGFTFTREPLESLYANKWFKDIGRLLLASKIGTEIGPKHMHLMYEDTQKTIIKQLNNDFGLGIQKSDALLLGYLRGDDAELLDENQKKLIEPFKRGDSYRFCLTPYFERMDKQDMINSLDNQLHYDE